MKILLVAPAIEKYLLKPGEKPKEVRQFRFSLLSLLSVAACTPESHSVEIIDEHIEHLDFDRDADVVGVTLMTSHAPRSYQIGDEFLKRNRVVVFGGFHPSFLPGEALEHCSAVVIGEAEDVWPQLLRDVQEHGLRRVYSSTVPVNLATLNNPPRHVLKEKEKEYFTINAVQVSRGCENECGFCSIHEFYGGYRMRPVDSVVEELRSIRNSCIVFVDDNIVGNAEYSHQLFRALIPLKKKWVSQASLKIVENPALLRAAARSGCRGLFVGFETINDRTLRSMGKSFNRVKHYEEAV